MPQVLVVDDDTSIRNVMRFALEDEGYVVREAADGKSALADLRNTRGPLVVLLDLMMPRLTGEEVLAAVAADADLAARHAFILVTANALTLTATCRRLLEQLRAPVVAKPFDIDSLLALVAAAAARLVGLATLVAVAC